MQSPRDDPPAKPAFVPTARPTSTDREAASPEESELEQSLSVFDSLAPPAEQKPAVREPAEEAEPTPEEAAESSAAEKPAHPEFDFGDLSDLDPIPVGNDAPASGETGSQGAGAPPTEPENAEPVGLDLAGGAPPDAHAGEADAAAEQLQRRIRDLLDEAKARQAAGSPDDALAVLSRVFILDEENAEARALEERIRAEAGHAAREMDEWITEAVQMMESDRLEEAKDLLDRVMQQCPHHSEARGYLEQIEERLAAKSNAEVEKGEKAESLPGAEAKTPPAEGDDATDPVEAIPLASPPQDRVPAPEQLHQGADEFGEMPIPAVEDVDRPAARRLPWLRWASYAAGALVLAGVAAWFLLPRGTEQDASAAVGTPDRAAHGAKAGGGRARVAKAPDMRTPEEKARALRDAMSRAQRSFDAGDFAAAVIAYNEVLKLDPENDDAIAGLVEAGARYKEQHASQEQLDRAKAAFRDGEYRAALRMFYRLSPEAGGPAVERYKVNGWYNLAMVALRAGDCKTAADRFQEALAIAPDDPGARQGLELAQRYGKQLKDLSFYRAVDRLGFRDLEGNNLGS